MVTKRIIPCLDIKDGRVVKGVNFLNLQDVSNPVKLADYYSRSGADELVFYDITASFEGRKLLPTSSLLWHPPSLFPSLWEAASTVWRTLNGSWPVGRTRCR